MISVIILGTGNVGTHLIKAFLKAENVNLVQVFARKKEALGFIDDSIDCTTDIANLKQADIYIIAISDNAISEFSSQLFDKNKLVVHTSGAVSIKKLKNKGSKGVFYPLQTFSKTYPVNFKEIPICIEADTKTNLTLLNQLASSISEKVYNISSDQRKYIHVAAVFINNFVNHTYKIGFDICKENNIPQDILYPLLLETAKKATFVNPSTIQTGPAYRNDTKTIATHIELLSEEQKIIYKIVTESIQKTYGKKL